MEIVSGLGEPNLMLVCSCCQHLHQQEWCERSYLPQVCMYVYMYEYILLNTDTYECICTEEVFPFVISSRV